MNISDTRMACVKVNTLKRGSFKLIVDKKKFNL